MTGAVFIRNKGDIVGYGKYVLVGELGIPSTNIHGHDLSQFEKKGDYLVGIHSVQIFTEFEEREYPYLFKSFEDVPVVLGDLNKTELAFKKVIAWDKNKLVDYSGSLPPLDDSPRNVSVTSMSTIRQKLQSSPTKVRFASKVRTLYLSERKECATEVTENIQTESSGGRFESSSSTLLRQLSAEFDQENEENGSFLENFDESVEQNAYNLELEEADVHTSLNNMETREGYSPMSRGKKRSSNYLSPAERISRRLDERAKKSLNCSHSGDSGRSDWILPRESEEINRANPEFMGNGVEGELSYNNSETDEGKLSVEAGPAASFYMAREFGASSRRPFQAIVNRLQDPRFESRSCTPEVKCPSPIAFRDPTISSVTKRNYRYQTRRPSAPKPTCTLEKKRLELWQKSFDVNPFEKLSHCCKNDCYSDVDPEYAVLQYRRFLRMKGQERKRVVRGMYNYQEKIFRFGGVPVCTRFVRALSFSNQLQCAVKGTPRARATASIFACPREHRAKSRKNSIILFLRTLAGAVGDSFPTRNHTNLLLLAKCQVYERYLKTSLSPGEIHASFNYFCSVWKQYCYTLKTHRRHGFTVCAICEKLRSSLAECEDEKVQAVIRDNMTQHYAQMEEKRRGYESRIELTKKFPPKFLSIIVDGADQKSYGLPHFVFNTKDEVGPKLKVKCVGVLEHGHHKHLSLFTLTEEFESGANHVIEAIHRVLTKKKSDNGKLPEVLFVQADNCTRENKNRYFMGYFQLLVAFGVFREVQISFLPIGHTHADIDKAFSTVASRLRLFDAITMEELIDELNNCYSPRASRTEMDRVSNFSGLCQESACLLRVQGFSQYRYFRFHRKKDAASDTPSNSASSGMPGANFSTTCVAKIRSEDEWSPMDNSSAKRGFLKFDPDIRKTPATDTTPPDNVLEVNKHLQSCEVRLKSENNKKSLENFRGKVYTRRVDSFHWDLKTAFELHGDYRNGSKDFTLGDSAEKHASARSVEGVGYSLNWFVAVKTEPGEGHPFWVARILRVEERDAEGHATVLKVRWYQLRTESRDAFSGRYQMSTFLTGSKRTFYDDNVDVRSILCQFEGLTQKGGLHI